MAQIPLMPNYRGALDISDIANTLSDLFKQALLYRDGRLRLSALVKHVNRRKTLPAPFIEAFNGKYPNYAIPRYDTRVLQSPARANSQQEPSDQAGGGDANLGTGGGGAGPSGAGGANNAGTNHGTRRFTWMVTDFYKEKDLLNKRNADGTLKPLSTYTNTAKEGDFIVGPELPVPADLVTPEWLEHWDEVHQLNGKVVYDAEKYALGSLQKSHYFLLPSNWPLNICPIEDIGAGLKRFPVSSLDISAIYSLAKEQALTLEFNEDKAIRWAALRTEAYKTGWFDFQKYTMHKPVPRDFISTFMGDGEKGRKAMEDAYTLCCFLPFLAEFHFRSYGNTYNKTNATEYVARAQKLAAAAQISDLLAYMDQDLLFGACLGWVEVKRPMLALQCLSVQRRMPNIFVVRLKSAPAGQAIITTSAAVIRALISANWWAGIKQAGKYEDIEVLRVADKITNNPWKYHLMHNLYGVEGPSDEEKKELEKARQMATLFAPILQAYIDVVANRTELGKARALKKYAEANIALYMNAQTVFRKANRRRGENVAELFASQVFKPALTIEEIPPTVNAQA